MPTDAPGPKDRFITVYGFRPVAAVLADDQLEIDKLIVADDATGSRIADLVRDAGARRIPVERTSRHRVNLLSGNSRHDNGVLADVVAPGMRMLADALAMRPDLRPRTVVLLDGVVMPANVGSVLRTATAAGIDGIVVPHRGVAALDPLVVKGSAGVAFRAPILRCDTAEDAALRLVEAGYAVIGLDAGGSTDLFDAELTTPLTIVLGSEGHGLSSAVRPYVSDTVGIRMPGSVESLNVAAAAAVVCFELVRRGLTATS